MTANTVLELDGVTKQFGSLTAVDNLSFSMRSGSILGFLGPNGSGKSTTMRIIVGLTTATKGRALINGVPYRKLADPIRTVGAIVDGVGHTPGLRAIDELAIAAKSVGIARQRCEEVLDTVGLTAAAGRRVGGFSLGMRQRMGLAHALLGDPELLLLDEPANGLDPQGIQWVRELLRSLAAEGRAILVSSHLLSEVAKLADDVLVIRHGAVIAKGTIAELTSGTARLTVVSSDPARLAERLSVNGAAVVRADNTLTVTGITAEQVGQLAFDAGIALQQLASSQTDLEEAFLELTQGEGIR
ncbi:MAG: ATP-binding cassette domain-containing protein [Nitriliruptoraceae bacterium]